MTKKQYGTPKVSVGTVKKSIAAMASRWFLRNVSQRFTESGSLGARWIHRDTPFRDLKTQLEQFAVNTRRSPGRILKARTSLLTRSRPPTFLTFETHAQYKRKPARCQFTTVLGVTKMSGLVHPDQNVLNATQNSLSRAVNRR